VPAYFHISLWMEVSIAERSGNLFSGESSGSERVFCPDIPISIETVLVYIAASDAKPKLSPLRRMPLGVGALNQPAGLTLRHRQSVRGWGCGGREESNSLSVVRGIVEPTRAVCRLLCGCKLLAVVELFP